MLKTETLKIDKKSYTFSEPTGRDMIAIADASNGTGDKPRHPIETMAFTVALLSHEPKLTADELMAGSFNLLERLASGLEIFPVFRKLPE
jgi:hypothetical protein